MDKLEDVLKHYGVKGMRWGVRRDRGSSGSSGSNSGTGPKKSKLKKHLDSWKREREWGSLLSQIHSMNTKDINKATARINMENNLKKLSKSKIATSKDKDDYLRRESMSDQELSRKVARLQAKERLRDSIRNASKEQREFGEKVVNAGSSIAINVAMKKKLEPQDIFNAVTQPKKASGDAKRDLTNTIIDNTNLSSDIKKQLKDVLKKSSESKKDKK